MHRTRHTVLTALAALLLTTVSGLAANSLTITNGLTLHLDAGSLTTLTNGAFVAAWPDLGTNGFDAAQGNVTNQPIFVTNAINGHPAVRFDGTNDYLDGPAVALTAQTIVLVARLDAAAPILSGVFAQKNADANNIRALTPTTWNAPGNGANTADFCVNGNSYINGRYGYTHANRFHVLAMTADSPRVFQYRLSQTRVANAYDRYFMGDLAEILIYDHTLTATELGQVGLYFERKYGMDTAYGTVENLRGAGNITADSATLNGNLCDTAGGQTTQVSVCWGTTDGGADYGAWGHTNAVATLTAPQSVSLSLTGLAPATTYYYRLWADNAVAGKTAAEATAVFRTDFMAAPGAIALWLSADAIPGATNGAAVDRWPDLSGNDVQVIQDAETIRPAVITNAVGGRPVVRNAGGHTLLIPFPVNPMNKTMFLVHRQDNVQTSWTLAFGGNLHTTTSAGTFCLTRQGGAFQINATIPTRQFSVNWLQMAAGNYAFRVNGTFIGASANTSTLTALTRVGNDFIGDIAEVIVFDGLLTATQQAEVGLYLERKYGIATDYTTVDNDGGATEVTPTTATLRGSLNDTDSYTPTVVRVCWGTSDGGAAFGSWEHTNTVATFDTPTPFAQPVSNLAPATLYFYRTIASNAIGGVAWAPTAARFETRFCNVNDGLALWLDADYFRGATNGTPVTSWPDFSGSGNHAVIATAARTPTFQGAQLGSRPVVRFDGYDDYMDGPAANLTAQTIFMVLKVATNAPTLSGVLCQKGADSRNIRIGEVGSTWRTPGNGVNGGDFPNGGTVYINGGRGWVHNYAYHILEETASGPLAFQYRLSQTNFGTPGRHFKGDLAEVIVYNRALSRAERREVGRYLADKYGFTDTAYGLRDLPAATPNPILWYDLSQQESFTNGADVTRLIDFSGNSGDGTPAAAHSGTYVANAVGSQPVVRLDGADAHYFTFAARTTIRTVFWVLAEDPAATPCRFLLGHAGGARYDFHRDNSANSYIWSQGWSPLMVEGSTRLNGVDIDGRVTKMPKQPAILSVRTSGNATANSLSRDRVQNGRNWQGDIAELLIYDRVLSDTEERVIGQYLSQKYGLDTRYSAVANLPAASIARHAARINGMLAEADANAPATVAVYWGETDGGTNAAAWATNHVFGVYDSPAACSLVVTNLESLTTYFYRFRAESAGGTQWADTSEPFRTTGHGVTNGLVAWLDASGLTNFGAGDAVALLRDWSGHGNHAMQTNNAARPSYEPDATNGQSVVRFNGTNTVLEGFKPLTARGLLIVSRVDADAPTLSGVFCQQGADAQNVRAPTPATWNAPGATADVRDFCYGGSMRINGISGSVHGGKYHLLHVVSAGTPHFQYRLSQPLYSRYFKGELAEVMIYDRDLTTAEQYELGTYVAARYGLVIDYPVVNVTGIGAYEDTRAAVVGNLAITNAAVTLYFGTADGGFVSNAWQHSTTATVANIGDFELTAAGLLPDTTYYARFYATNAADSGWSASLATLHTRPALAVTNGMTLWYTASALTGYAGGERIPTLPDLSGNGRTGTASTGSPVYMPNIANGRPVVRFDGGTNTYYTFARLDDIRTVFWVVREDADAAVPGFLLGSEGIGDIYHFHRDTSATRYFWNANTSTNVLNGTTKLDGRVVNGRATRVPTDRLALISLRTIANCTANAFVSDRLSQGVKPARTWNGDLAELIVYDRALSDEEESQVGRYLSERYRLSTGYVPGTILFVR